MASRRRHRVYKAPKIRWTAPDRGRRAEISMDRQFAVPSRWLERLPRRRRLPLGTRRAASEGRNDRRHQAYLEAHPDSGEQAASMARHHSRRPLPSR
jgi:hypothetical protein